MNLNNLYYRGVSFDEFVNDDSDTYKEKTLEIYNNINFDNELVKRIKKISRRINVIVCAEIWCTDCMINVPVLEKMRMYNDRINISIVGKDGNIKYFSKYSIHGTVKIPTFIFMDKNFNELGSFVEYPNSIKNLIMHGKKSDIVVAKRKYKKGEYADEILKDILEILL